MNFLARKGGWSFPTDSVDNFVENPSDNHAMALCSAVTGVWRKKPARVLFIKIRWLSLDQKSFLGIGLNALCQALRCA